MDFKLSFAGIPFVLNTPELMEWCGKSLPEPHKSIIFPERPFPVGQQLLGLAQPFYRPEPDLKIGSYYYPTDASRWSIANFVIGQTGMEALLPLGFNPPTPQTFLLQQDTQVISTLLYAFPPKPLSSCSPGVFLVTLVDERYYWQYRNSSLIIDDDTTWQDLINVLKSDLGIILTLDSVVEEGYASPQVLSDLSGTNQNSAFLLDAVMWNIGRTLIRNHDGTYTAKKNDELVLDLPDASQAGGDWSIADPSLAGNLVPASVTVLYPYRQIGTGDFINVEEQHLPYKRTAGDVHSETVGIEGTDYAGLLPVDDTVKVFIDTAEAWVANAGDPPINADDINDLTVLLANDFYGGIIGGLDQSFPRLLPAQPIDQCWYWGPDECYTRITTKPYNYFGESFNHHFISPACVTFSELEYDTDGVAGGTLVITVLREGNTTGTCSVHYTTHDGTATAGVDYTATSGTLNFANGDASKTFNVTIAPHPTGEGNLDFTITLDTPVNVLICGDTTTVVIDTGEPDCCGVTRVGLHVPGPLTVSGSPITHTGTFDVEWQTLTGDLLYASAANSMSRLPFDGTPTRALINTGNASTTPKWGKINLSNGVENVLPTINGGTGQTTYTDGQLLIGISTGGTLVKNTLTAGSGIGITNGPGTITITAVSGGGTVTSVGLHAPFPFSVGGSPITGAGTFDMEWLSATGDVLYASATNTMSRLPFDATPTKYIANTGNASTTPKWDKVNLSNGVQNILPTVNGGTGQSTYSDGQLLIGITTGGTLVKNTLTAGTGISVVNGAGTVTIANTGVTSVGLHASSPLTVTNTPITTTGVMELSWQSATGDVLYASASNNMTRLPFVSTSTRALINTGNASSTPKWGQINLNNGVENVLRTVNGGTGQTTYTDGQLLIGITTGGTLVKGTLTAGTGISIVNGPGTITIASTGGSGGGAIFMQVQTFTVSGMSSTWVKPDNWLFSRVTCVGGGGGGGGGGFTSGQNGVGAGGGGGGVCIKVFNACDETPLGATEDVFVGPGGAGGTGSTGGNGESGQASTFATMTAGGGNAGDGMPPNDGPDWTAGGNGGGGFGGDVNYTGQAGANGILVPGAITPTTTMIGPTTVVTGLTYGEPVGIAGIGGASFVGGGFGAFGDEVQGGSGGNYGGGGGGGAGSGKGGDGGNGVVFTEDYCSECPVPD